jgi:hypothetical protein
MNDLTQLDLHYLTLCQTNARVNRAYLDAVIDRVEEPTILVLDLRDGQACVIAALLVAPDIIRGMLARADQLQKVPSLVIRLSRPEAITTVASCYPEMGSALAASNDSEFYLAVVIAFGGGQIFVLRRPFAESAHVADRPFPAS